MPAVAQPILVDGSGRGLAVGVKAGSEVPTFDLTPGARAERLVQVSNYCGPDPVAPVSVSFEFGDGRGIDAEPRSSDDVTVPPCNGPGQPSEITMHPWSPA